MHVPTLCPWPQETGRPAHRPAHKIMLYYLDLIRRRLVKVQNILRYRMIACQYCVSFSSGPLRLG